MPILHVRSHKPRAARDWIYPVTAGDIEGALLPHLKQDMFLEVQFQVLQSHRKELRDQIEESRRFRLMEAQYSFGGHHLARAVPGIEPWRSESRPQVVTARVFAIPRRALRRGVARRPLLAELLTRAFGLLAPRGLPSTPSPRGAWILDLELDATTQAAQAILKPWNGGEHAVSQRIEVTLLAGAPD